MKHNTYGEDKACKATDLTVKQVMRTHKRGLHYLYKFYAASRAVRTAGASSMSAGAGRSSPEAVPLMSAEK